MQSVWIVVLFVFSVWMTIDAIRRRAAPYWYLVILLLPFGAIIYFVLVKLQDHVPGSAPAGRYSQDPTAEAKVEGSPIPAEERLQRAKSLEDRGRFAEAASLYETLISSEKSSADAKHGLARCKLSLGEPEEAVRQLASVVEQDRAHADYGAALDYAEALWQNGQEQDAVDLAKALAEHTGRPNHRLAAAHYMAGLDQRDEALQLVDGVIDELTSGGDRSQSKWLKKAQAMQRHLGS